MPSRRRAHHLRARSWLAVWFAALLAIAPLGQPFGPAAAAWIAAGPSVSSFSADDDLSRSQEPAAGLQAGQQSPPGVLSRLSLVETTLGLPPVKFPFLKPRTAEAAPVASEAAATHVGLTDESFHRSSVGTARTPTGPPL